VVSPKTKQGKVNIKQSPTDPLWELFYNVSAKLEAYRQTLVYGAIAVVAAVILGSIIYMFVNSQRSQGQEAFAQALDIYNAPVVKAGSDDAKNIPAGKKTYPEQQQKFKDAATAFDNVANNHSSFATLARYYGAMSRTHFDQSKAQSELEALSKESSDVGFWSKIALAELYAASGQNDKALSAYQQLKDNSGPLPKSHILYNLGRIYERAGKNPEAIDSYFQSAQADRSSGDGRKSVERLNVLAPDKVKNLPPEKKEELGDI
jgi:tetratricopeptide (TPR) repeat protein